MTTHWIWFPIANLKSLVKPIGPKPNSLQLATLSNRFTTTIRGAIVMFARQTILQFFRALQGTESLYRTLQSEAFLLHDIISWGVLESFSESPITGWTREFSNAMPIHRLVKEEAKASTAVTKSPQESASLISRILGSQVEA